MKKIKLYTLYIIIVIISASMYFSVYYKKENENRAVVIIRSQEEIVETTVTEEEKTANKSEKTTKKESSIEKTTKKTEEKTEEITEIQRIDINKADVEELTKLKGIGAVTAEEIVRYREENGLFENVDELLNVKGIGEIKLNEIRDYIYVESLIYNETTEIITEPQTEPPTDEIITEHIITLEEASPININTAEKDELMLLPNVDEQTAESIIKLRDQIGEFQNPLELIYIDELTQKEVSELLEFVTVGNMQ